MLRTFLHSRFFTKLFYELLPAAIASAIGTLLLSNYAKQPAAEPPQAVATQTASPTSTELMQMVRYQQSLFADYLKKSAEARQEADLAAERNAVLALREARAAETRALAIAARTAEKPEKRIAAKFTDKPAEKAVTGEPLQLTQMMNAAAQKPAQVQAAAPAALAPATQRDDSGVMGTLRSATATVVRVPSQVTGTVSSTVSSWVSSATGWFSEDAPPRPPAQVSSHLNAAM